MENSGYYEQLEKDGKEVVYSFIKDDLGSMPLSMTIVAGEIVSDNGKEVEIKYSLGEEAILDYVIDTEGNKLSTDLIREFDPSDVHTEDNRRTIRCKKWEIAGTLYGYNATEDNNPSPTYFLWGTKKQAVIAMLNEVAMKLTNLERIERELKKALD